MTEAPPELQVENTYHWPPDGESRPWTEFWVTTFTSPPGAAAKAAILFSLDDGREWRHRPMEKACMMGEQDVWHVTLGLLPADARIRYAVEGVDQRGRSVWDNNHGRDHHALIGSPKDLKVP